MWLRQWSTFTVSWLFLGFHFQRSRPWVFKAPWEILLWLITRGEVDADGLRGDHDGLRGDGRELAIRNLPQRDVLRQVRLLRLLEGGQLLSPVGTPESFPPWLLVSRRKSPEHVGDLLLRAGDGEYQVRRLTWRGHRGLQMRGFDSKTGEEESP